MSQELETPANHEARSIAASGPRFWSASAKMFFGNATYAACQGGWLILISKLTSEKSRGQFVLAMAIASTVIAFAGLGLRAMLATDVKQEHNFSSYFVLRLVSCLFAFSAVFAVALLQ